MDSSINNNKYVTSSFKSTINRSNVHNGLDFRSTYGENVYSVRNGTVLMTKEYLYKNKDGTSGPNRTGQTIVQETTSIGAGDPLYVRYMHLSALLVSIDSVVSEGTLMGRVGNSGNVGTHLHLDISSNKTVSDRGNPTDLSPNDAWNPAAFFPNIAFTGESCFVSNKN